MAIALVSIMALLTSLDIATGINLGNLQREEAVQLAGQQMSEMRVTPFANISASYPLQLVSPKLRGASGAPPYRVVKSSVNLSDTSKLVNVRVRWLYKNMSTSYEVQSVIQE